MQAKIEIMPYQAQWRALFAEEAKRLAETLGEHMVAIYHIGSTAIPHMPAKPVIDILFECHNLDAIAVVAAALEALGYHPLIRHISPHNSYFTKCSSANMTYHLHLREQGDPQIKRHLYLIDYLNAHPEDAKAYANLKAQLAKQHPFDRIKYTAGKEKLIQHLCAKTKRWKKNIKSLAPLQRGNSAAQFSKEKIVKAIEENINLHITHFAQYLDAIELIRIPGFTLVNACLADAEFNVVLDAYFQPEQALTRIKEILHIIQAQAYPFTWLVAPYDQPKNLHDYFEKFDLGAAATYFGVYCDLDHVINLATPNTLTMQQALDKKTFYDFASLDPTNVRANEIYFFNVVDILDAEDPFEYYVAYQENVPVARGALVYGAQVAGIYHLAATDNSYENMMLQFLLQRAQTLGFHLATSLVAEGLENTFYEHGFKVAAKFYKYTILAA